MAKKNPEWQTVKDEALNRILSQAVDQGMPDDTSNPVYQLTKRAISRLLDEKYSKADDKQTAVDEGIDHDIHSLLAGARSEKQDLIAEMAKMTGLSESVFQSTPVKEMKAALGKD